MDRLIAYINREIKSREVNLRSGNIVNYEQYKLIACEIRLLDALKTKNSFEGTVDKQSMASVFYSRKAFTPTTLLL